MPRVAFLFPGQGAQTVGMGQALCQAVPAAKRLFDQAADIVGYDLLAVCTAGPAEKLNATDVSQPAIYVASLAALESLRASDPTAVEGCAGTAGLSLGEYTALTFAGALSFADGLRVVQARGRAMQAAADAQPGGMVSVLGLERAQVESICQAASGVGTIQVANLLCPGNIAVSGEQPALAEVERLVTEQGARTVRLAVAGAFHTDLMKPADEQLAAALSEVELKPPRVPVWSNVDAKPHTDPGETRQLLVRQVVSPVLWEDSIRGLMGDGFDKFYEVGPGRVLAGLLKRVQRKADCTNVAA
ncbi:MAG TPA: ACP S-malonyltransferase [Gemmataceae bacterium]|jgi:[acyl-carrier-protein] S-malonyltransferase